MVLRKLSFWLLHKLCTAMNMKLVRKINGAGGSSTSQLPKYSSVTQYPLQRKGSTRTLVCDIHTTLLRTKSFFPYFMLVAFEGGSILRAFFLLLSCPILWVLDFELKLRVMIFITFCGLRLKDMEIVGRAVLPKFFLENLNPHVYEVLVKASNSDGTSKVLILTSVPRVMVEGFLKECISSVDDVKGTELQTIGKYFTGLLSSSGLLVKHRALKEFYGQKQPDIIGIGSLTLHDHQFLSICKEAYVVNKEDRKTIMPREKYPKPLVFHDGRLAFFPTPLATLTMFLWLPLGIILAIFRTSVVVFFPSNIARFLIRSSGVIHSFKVWNSPISQKGKGVVYVCNHRTLLDPVFLNLTLNKPLTAVTYSLSRFSELISPIRTARLKRDRKQDREIIEKLLSEGDLVVCPEGTTCREPYLLRFSSLFAELTDDIVPIAVNTHVTMFYGTTASGLKCLDPIFFAMNPRPSYDVRVLDKVPEECTMAGGKSRHEVANYIQGKLADALGFRCTNFTRKDKYMILAGNEGLVREKGRK